MKQKSPRSKGNRIHLKRGDWCPACGGKGTIILAFGHRAIPGVPCQFTTLKRKTMRGGLTQNVIDLRCEGGRLRR
jgi:hypothetical protein